MKNIVLTFLLFFISLIGFSQENLQQNTNEATWDQGIPYFPESQTVTEMIDKLNINEILNGKKLTINEVKLCREIGIAFYNRGMYDAAEWYLDKTKGYIDIVELDVEKDVHYICDELKKKEEEKKEDEEKISTEDDKSIQSDLNFVANLPKSFEKVSKQDLKKIANEIDDKINQLLAQKDSLLKAKAKQELIDAKDETINTLNKEKDIIDLTITNDDLKVETQELTVEKNSLRKYLMWVSAGLVLLILIILVLLQRKTIKVQDVEIENQLKDISKKNTYLEHAARIIRHDMHSGINTYIPRGITSLEKRLTPEDITNLKIDSSLKMIKEGLNHTQKVYKSVYEFTNLVKQNVVLDKKEVNLKTLLDSYLLGTSFKNQVVVETLPDAKVNEILFCNAIDNLIRNGLKYNNSENKEVKIFMEENNLIVQDNGVGLSQKEFDSLRKAYTKRKDSEDYSGLGLSICLAILNEHGFDLTCEKNEIGTKMKIKLI